MFACAILAVLSLTLLPSLSATTVAPMQSPPTFTNWVAWQAYITKVPTPQAGCFEANYPNPVWQQVQCGPASSQPMTVGNTNDWIAQVGGGTGKLLTYSIGTLSTTGLTSETDVCVGPPPFCTSGGKGAHYYSLQINSNIGFPVTYHGKSTTGWEQFLYDSEGFSGSCGPTSPTCGLIFIEYWLLGYAKANGGKCPPAKQDPPGGGFGWAKSGADCYFNTDGTLAPAEYATSLYLVTMTAYAHPTGNPNDGVTFCVFLNGCYAKSITYTVLNLWKQWKQSEFNVFGYDDGSQAQFNSGTTITVQQVLEDHLGVAFGTASCLKGGFTGETNNLNLGSCSTGNSYIDFTESN